MECLDLEWSKDSTSAKSNPPIVAAIAEPFSLFIRGMPTSLATTCQARTCRVGIHKIKKGRLYKTRNDGGLHVSPSGLAQPHAVTRSRRHRESPGQKERLHFKGGETLPWRDFFDNVICLRILLFALSVWNTSHCGLIYFTQHSTLAGVCLRKCHSEASLLWSLQIPLSTRRDSDLPCEALRPLASGSSPKIPLMHVHGHIFMRYLENLIRPHPSRCIMKYDALIMYELIPWFQNR